MKRSLYRDLIETFNIIGWRLNYLASLKQFRRGSQTIKYFDETWASRKRKSLIILHIRSELGCVEEEVLLFEGTKVNYNTEIFAIVFDGLGTYNTKVSW